MSSSVYLHYSTYPALVVVVGHTNCGGVAGAHKAACSAAQGEQGELKSSIPNIIPLIRIGYS